MLIVIPCGGLATRLGKLAENKPKAMMNIDGKPFLEHQINLIKKYDFDELVLCIGHLGEQIQEYFGDGNEFGITIKYSKDNGLDVIGAIKNAEPLLRDNFIMMYGDSYLPAVDFNELYEKFLNQEKPAMMTVWKNQNKIDPSNIKVENNEVVGVKEPDSQHIDYGAIALNKKTLRHVPENTTFSTAAFWKKLAEHHELATYEIYERYYDIGSEERLNEVKTLVGGKIYA